MLLEKQQELTKQEEALAREFKRRELKKKKKSD